MVEYPPDLVKQIQDYIAERISQEGGDAYISPENHRDLNDLADLTYPRCDDEESFSLQWLMEETGNENLPGRRFTSKRSSYYTQLRQGYRLALLVWSNFRRSNLHTNHIAWTINYLNGPLEEIWKSQSWKDAHDLMVYRLKAKSSLRMETYIPEAVVFEFFKKAFREIGIPFFVAGRGNPYWWPPDFFEWSTYKFDNILHRLQDLRNIEDVLDAGTILPEGFTAQELMDLRQSLRQLVLRAATAALDGPSS